MASLTVISLLAANQFVSAAGDDSRKEEKTVRVVVAGSPDGSADTKGFHERLHTVVVKGVEPVSRTGTSARKELPWLGVATDEASEVLMAQLGLDPGVGLVVSFVASNSPAAKSGLQKNDVLVEFEGQSLVHPAQLRKLVQARKEGDTVKLAYYRAGKKQTTSATLAKTTAGFGLLDDEHAWRGDLMELQRQLRDLPIGDAIREQMKSVRESLGNVRIDQQRVREEIHRSMSEAHKALKEALKSATNSDASLDPAVKALRELDKYGAHLDNKTTVVVRNSGKAIKTLVKTDDTGTIIITSDPKLHLTAQDKDGKQLFDGEIETQEQRAKVPPEVWKQAEPLLEKMNQDAKAEDSEDKDEDAGSGKQSIEEKKIILKGGPEVGEPTL
jgi:hypothetical protein